MFAVRKSAPVVLERLQNGLSHPSIELVYTSHPRWPLWRSETQPTKIRTLRISVLDSSFNPPTVAHLALANSPRQGKWSSDETDSPTEESRDYDAKLLLLSVKNADKSLKPGDATYLQRLEMMSLLAQSIHTRNSGSSPSFEESANVAIAIIDEPTFVGKSDALLKFLKHKFTTLSESPLPHSENVELTFLVGLDTLERLFSLRYYPSQANMTASLRRFFSTGPGGDNSRIVCANRVFTPTTLQSPGESKEAKSLSDEFHKTGRIAVIDIGEKLSTYSSSAVRGAISRDGLGQKDDGTSTWKNFVTAEVAQYIMEEQLYNIAL